MEFVQLIGVYKSFPIGKRTISTLRNVNFSISAGEFVLLLGPSGSGKTTLLNLIAGIDKPSYGQIFIDQEEISRMKPDELSSWRSRNIGFIFQSYNLMSYMTALDNVALPLVFQGVSKKKRNAKAKNMLKAVGMSNMSDNACQVLSGGEQQRVTIARALINNPKILIADEPTGDLDSKNAAEVMNIIYSLYKERKTTIIMATHNEDYIKFADKIIRLHDGRAKG